MLTARWWTLAVWAIAAASALFWGLKLFVKPQPLPPSARVASAAGAAQGDVSRLFGAVGARGATLGPRDGAAAVALNLAPQPVAATGVLPSLSLPGQSGMPAPPAQPLVQPMPQQMLPPGQRRFLPPQQLPAGAAPGTESPGLQQPNQALTQ